MPTTTKVCGNCKWWQPQGDRGLIGDCTVTLPMLAYHHEQYDAGRWKDQSCDDCNCFAPVGEEIEITLPEFEITLDRVWFTFKKHFSVCVHTTDEGMVVDIYPKGVEDGECIASTYAFDSEVKD